MTSTSIVRCPNSHCPPSQRNSHVIQRSGSSSTNNSVPILDEQLSMPSFTFRTTNTGGGICRGSGDSRSFSASKLRHETEEENFINKFAGVLNAPIPPSLRTNTNVSIVHNNSDNYCRHNSNSINQLSTPLSGRTPHRHQQRYSRTIHDDLYDQGKRDKLQRDVLQEEGARRERSTLRSPKISQYAKDQEKKRTERLGKKEDVIIRMESRAQKSKEKKQKRIDELLEIRRKQEVDQYGCESDTYSDYQVTGTPSRRHSTSRRDTILKTSCNKVKREFSILEHGKRRNSSTFFSDGSLSFSNSRRIKGNMDFSPSHHHNRSTTSNHSLRQRRRPFYPKLTHKGRLAMSKVTQPDFILGHHRRTQQFLDRRYTEKVVKEFEEVRDPDITLRSKVLSARRNKREGYEGMNHLDIMLERDKLAKLRKWEQMEQQRIDDNLFQPKITMYAATLGNTYRENEADTFSSGPKCLVDMSHSERARMEVSQRLYADSFAKEEKRAARMRELEEQHISDSKVGKWRSSSRNTYIHCSSHRNRSCDTGDNDECSVATSDSQHTGKGQSRHASLHNHAADMRRKREETKLQEEELERLMHRPAINPVSQAITARLPQTAQERLLAPRKSVRNNECQENSSPVRYQSVPRSAGYGSNAFNEMPAGKRHESDNYGTRKLTTDEESTMLQKLEIYEERKREKLRQLREAKDDYELGECTFRPQIHVSVTTGVKERSISGGDFGERNGVNIRDQNTDYGDEDTHAPRLPGNGNGDEGNNHLPIEERAVQWQQRKEAKLESQRREHQAKAISQCTFKPVTSGASGDVGSGSNTEQRYSSQHSANNPSLYGGDGTPWGTDAYIARQDYARELQLEKEAKLMGRKYVPKVPAFFASKQQESRPPQATDWSNRQAASPPSTSDSGAGVRSLIPPAGPDDIRHLLTLNDEEAYFLQTNPSADQLLEMEKAAERQRADLPCPPPLLEMASGRGRTSVYVDCCAGTPITPPSMW